MPPGATLDPGRLIELRNIALSSGLAPRLAALPGGFATRRKGHGLEVADSREYETGDDFRTLDRGATARTGRLHVRQFQEDRDRIGLLVADFRPPMFWGLKRCFRSVAAAEVLALVGWHLVESGGRVGLMALSGKDVFAVPPRPRARGMLDVIRGLVDAHSEGLERLIAGDRDDAELETALARAERITPAGSEVFLASGFDGAGASLGDRLNALSRRRSVRLIHVTAATHMPRGSYPVRLQNGRRHRVRIDGNARAREHVSTLVEGSSAFTVDAGDAPETTAMRLAAVLSEQSQ